MSFFGELKRRNIFKVAVAYLALGWVLVQITDVIVPALNLPETLNSIVVYIGIIGFPIALFFAWAFELTPDGVKKTEEVDAGESIRKTTGQKINYIIIGLLALAVVFLLVDRGAEPEPDELIIAELANTIAVMPFADMSADGSQEYFGDGMAEEILNVLVKIDDLDVTSRTTAFSLKGQNLSIPAIAERLNVNYILEGSIRSDGDTVRVTAQLIDVANDTHLWSDTFDRELTSIFAIQDDISLAIADALKVELLGDVLGDVPTQNMEAYALYLQGRQLMNYFNIEASLEMRDLANQAIELDPLFAEGWGLLSTSYMLTAGAGIAQYSNEEKSSLYNLMLEAANKALNLNPNIADAWSSKGMYHVKNLQWMDAKIAFEQATTLDPKNDFSWGILAEYYFSIGHYDYALDAINIAVEINPNGTLHLFNLGRILNGNGDVEQGRLELEKSINLGDGLSNFSRAYLLIEQGEREQAAKDFRIYAEYLGMPYNENLEKFIDAYYNPSLREDYKKLLPEILGDEPDTAYLVEPLTVGALLLHDGEFLVKAMKKMVTQRQIYIMNMFKPPLYPILNQTIVKEYLTEVGLIDHWRATKWPNFCRPVGENDFECGVF